MFIKFFICSFLFSLASITYSQNINPETACISSYLLGIVDMKVEQGQSVKKGDVLFTIETDYLETVKDKCRNAVWYYTEIYNRTLELNKIHSRSLEELQQAENDLTNAKGDLKREELLIDEWATYKAPFDGIITKIYRYSGSAAPSSSSHQNNNAVLEITKTNKNEDIEDKNIVTPVAEVASMVGGIVEMKVDVGDKVNKNDLLFSINMDYNKIIKDKQKANLDYWKAKYEREKTLYSQNTSSLKEYQTAEFNYRNTIEEIKASNIVINKRSRYHAPFDAVVTNIIHYSGSNTFAGHTVIEVSEIKSADIDIS